MNKNNKKNDQTDKPDAINEKIANLVYSDKEREKWLSYYSSSDPLLRYINQFASTLTDDENIIKEISIIVLMDRAVKRTTDLYLAHIMKRPMPEKVELGKNSYPEDNSVLLKS